MLKSPPKGKFLFGECEILSAQASGQPRYTEKTACARTPMDDAISRIRRLNFHEAYCTKKKILDHLNNIGGHLVRYP
jgi:hypothetical protein